MALPSINTIMVILVAVLGVITAGLFVYNRFMKKWNLNADIFEIRGGKTVLVNQDKATRTEQSQNKYIYEIKTEKCKTRPVEYEYVYLQGNGKSKIYLLKLGPKDYIPIRLDLDGAVLRPTDVDARHIQTNMLREATEEYDTRGLIERYQVLISNAMLFLGLVFFLKLGLDYMLQQNQISMAISASNAGTISNLVNLSLECAQLRQARDIVPPITAATAVGDG